jgi:hypothetical protein
MNSRVSPFGYEQLPGEKRTEAVAFGCAYCDKTIAANVQTLLPVALIQEYIQILADILMVNIISYQFKSYITIADPHI